MKYLNIILACIFLSGCAKVSYQEQPFQYTLTGISDVSVYLNDTTQVTITATLNGGNPVNEPITLAITGLPKDVTVNYDSITFRLNYTLGYVFKAGINAVPGIYPVQIIETNPSTGTTVHQIRLTVMPCRDLSTKVPGGYLIFEGNCAVNSGYLYIASVPGRPYTVTMTNAIYMVKSPVYAYFNCGDSTFTIPLQTVDSITFKGSGYYKYISSYPPYSAIYIEDTTYSGGLSTPCINQYEKR